MHISWTENNTFMLKINSFVPMSLFLTRREIVINVGGELEDLGMAKKKLYAKCPY